TYNSAGQLSCALCNQPVKSELLWNAHIQGRTHKEVNDSSYISSSISFLPSDGYSLPSDFFDSKPSVSSSQPKGILKTSKDLNFFDQGIAPSASSDAKEEKDHKEAVMSEKIPEGFFDDPKKDAKAREIEYKDKMDVEWDLFQRAMQEENHVSEAIIQEDDEELIAERSLVEIEEQMCRWTRVNELEKKKEKL
ncbi:hypothetical protein CAPTEDRAFT_26823, partial [Capitella teleta]